MKCILIFLNHLFLIEPIFPSNVMIYNCRLRYDLHKKKPNFQYKIIYKKEIYQNSKQNSKGLGLIACETDEHKRICFESSTYLSL